MNIAEIPTPLLPAVEELDSKGGIRESEATQEIHLLAKLGLASRSPRTGPEPKFPATRIVLAENLQPGTYLIREDHGHRITHVSQNPIGVGPFSGVAVGLSGSRDVVYDRGARVRISSEPVRMAKTWFEYHLNQDAKNALELRRLSSAQCVKPALLHTDGKLQVGDEFRYLEGQEKAVLHALVALRATSKRKLIDRSRVSDAPKVLKKIVAKYELEAYVTFPANRDAEGIGLRLG